MARKKSQKIVPTPMYKEPTPQERLKWAMGDVVEKAVLAHPQTQALRKKIETAMRKAAKTAQQKEA